MSRGVGVEVLIPDVVQKTSLFFWTSSWFRWIC